MGEGRLNWSEVVTKALEKVSQVSESTKAKSKALIQSNLRPEQRKRHPQSSKNVCFEKVG